MQHNRKLYRKIHEIKICKDKIYLLLQNNEIKDKILEGKLEWKDYNNKNIHKFLHLLKLPNRKQPNY